MKRDVLYLIDALEGGGAERQFCELVMAIKDNKDYQPHVGVLKPSKNGYERSLEKKSVRINYFTRRHRFDISPLFSVIKYVKENDIDLIHAFMQMGGDFGLMAGKICGVPVICRCIYNAKDRDLKTFLRTRYQSLLSNIAISNSEAGFMKRFGKMRPNFRVVYNGMDMRRADISEEDKDAVRRELGLGEENKIICSATRFNRQKDHATLIEAVKILVKDFPGLVVLLAGEGDTKKRIKDLVSEYGLNNNVRFLGFRKDIEKIMAVSDILIMLTNTRVHLEGISNVMIEAMAVKVPVIVTGGGGTEEVISNGMDNGIKVKSFSPEEVADAVRHLLENEAEARRMAENAYRMVSERFSIERYVNDNLEIYSEVMSGL